MTDTPHSPWLRTLLGTDARDPGCDAGLDVIDEYCEAVARGDTDLERYADFVNHLRNCAACREDTEGLLAAVREQMGSSSPRGRSSGRTTEPR